MTTKQFVNSTFFPAARDTPHIFRQFEELFAEVSDVIAPVWPLADYVAVNPYAGISQRNFMEARSFLQLFSDVEMLMPMEHYASQFQQGRFTVADIESAINEQDTGIHTSQTPAQIAQMLLAINTDRSESRMRSTPGNKSANLNRPIRSIAEYANSPHDVDWTEAIAEEISKHCSAHYDQGQAIWASPNQQLSLFEAWRTVAEHDYNIEILGLTGFRNYVARMPNTAEAAIVHSLQQLNVPVPLWSTFLLCQAFSIPGWSAWAKYQTSWARGAELQKNDLTGLLAIRLAYDAALAKAKSLHINWDSLLANESVSFNPPQSTPADDSLLRLTLLRASEIGYRNGLLRSFSIAEDNATNTSKDSAQQKLAQMVFCIDIRSERIRRQIECNNSDVETFGFAGFFGMAFEFVSVGETSGKSQLPVLLQPKFKLHQGLRDGDKHLEEVVISKRQQIRNWRAMWKSFQTSAIGCFSFVETTGLFYGLKLLGRTVGRNPKSVGFQLGGLCDDDRLQLRPTLRGLKQQGITAPRQVDMAEGMLRNLGLTKNFSQLVVFCGHACQTENNPLAAGLDCGACGGHSGEPNARFAAMLLNQPHIRRALADRGIQIPANTHFLGALHNTTTDLIEFFDVDEVPAANHAAFRELKQICATASSQTQIERLPSLASKSVAELLKRAFDWSEVRPEWGLAGNAAFVVAPRAVTKNANLNARCFLHSYDYTQDAQGSVLETIMTAPMIVAHWINMQYYASTVDNQNFGSGTKTVHNVVGRFGILSGNGGDLMTGLPWQSLHTGYTHQHQPMRLQVVIAAPRKMIELVIAKHELVENLVTGSWLHLIAIENTDVYRYTELGNWELMENICQVPMVAT